ncbi:MAG: type II secretion system protein GspG, partial [Candidatus Abyssubacteria bacterium]|nr:type II secretion system protein GspG [Candidatus Abyssubacteria bacterium]
WNGPYTEEDYLVDHYGVPYGYKVLRDIHGSPFVEVTTYGYDKKPGTSDDRRKLILEEDARRWEDRKNYR